MFDWTRTISFGTFFGVVIFVSCLQKEPPKAPELSDTPRVILKAPVSHAQPKKEDWGDENDFDDDDDGDDWLW